MPHHQRPAASQRHALKQHLLGGLQGVEAEPGARLQDLRGARVVGRIVQHEAQLARRGAGRAGCQLWVRLQRPGYEARAQPLHKNGVRKVAVVVAHALLRCKHKLAVRLGRLNAAHHCAQVSGHARQAAHAQGLNEAEAPPQARAAGARKGGKGGANWVQAETRGSRAHCSTTRRQRV